MFSERIEPLFFGPPDRRIYGCWHAPETGAPRALGVLIAAPFGHEHIRSHRALRQLASRLAQAGFGALRFDFRGSGDSAGDELSGSFAPWLEDLELAARELKRRTRSPRVAIAGLRMGATLALHFASERGGVECLELWEPALDGRACIAEWRELERRFLGSIGIRSSARAQAQPVQAPPPGKGDELECLGFQIPASLVGEIERLDPTALRSRPAEQVVLLESASTPSGEQLAARLQTLGVRLRREPYTGAQFWTEDLDKALVPSPALDAIVARLAELAA